MPGSDLEAAVARPWEAADLLPATPSPDTYAGALAVTVLALAAFASAGLLVGFPF